MKINKKLENRFSILFCSALLNKNEKIYIALKVSRRCAVTLNITSGGDFNTKKMSEETNGRYMFS